MSDDELLRRLGEIGRATKVPKAWEHLTKEHGVDDSSEDVIQLANRSPEWSEVVDAARPVDDAFKDRLVQVVAVGEESPANVPSFWSRWQFGAMVAAATAMASVALAVVMVPNSADLPEYIAFVDGVRSTDLELARDADGRPIKTPRGQVSIELAPAIDVAEAVRLQVYAKRDSRWHLVKAEYESSASGAFRIKALDLGALGGAEVISLVITPKSGAPKKPDFCQQNSCRKQELLVR